MRSVSRRRPLVRAKATPGDEGAFKTLAARASYTISTEHKDYLTEAGPGALRSDATPCPRDVSRDMAEDWLHRALAAHDVGEPWEGPGYPRYAWYRRGDDVFEARLTNAELGAYKGYPIASTEAPSWLA